MRHNNVKKFKVYLNTVYRNLLTISQELLVSIKNYFCDGLSIYRGKLYAKQHVMINRRRTSMRNVVKSMN